MGINMSFYHAEWGSAEEGLLNSCIKQKFRWKFVIPSICADGLGTLPHTRAARPTLSFKEMDAQHLIEQQFYPAKPEWKPLNLVLYDLVKDHENPVFTWLRKAYDAGQCARWRPASATSGCNLKRTAWLELYNGCGDVVEAWGLDGVWPQQVDFGELDMSDGQVLTCDLTLRYERAYITYPTLQASFSDECANYVSCDTVVEQEQPVVSDCDTPVLEFAAYGLVIPEVEGVGLVSSTPLRRFRLRR